MANIRRAVFLDRDGTLNHDPGYLDHPDKLKLLPGVADGLAKLAQAGFQRVVISNQSGIGRGKVTLKNLELIHQKMNSMLKGENPNAAIDDFYCCPHIPEDQCECRKPKPKLLKEAAQKHHLDLSNSYMIGDRVSDLESGLNAGCKKSLLVLTGVALEQSLEEIQRRGFLVFKSFSEAASWILTQTH